MAENPSVEDQVFLFSYDFQGSKYSLEVPAKSAAEAQFRLSKMASAQLDGVVQLKIGCAAGPLSRWLSKLGL